MLSIKESKAQARMLEKFLAEHQVALPHGVCLEAVARLQHKKNWATYLVEAKTESSFIVDKSMVAGWPVFVFFYEEDEVTLKEGLRVLPAGVRLNDPDRLGYGGVVLTQDSQPVPAGFKLDARTVVFDVQALVPSIAKYGMPWFANEETAADGFRKEFGCAAVKDISVSLRDTGDDSAEQFWFEAHVNPELAALLPSLSAAQREAQLTQIAYDKVFNRVFTDLDEVTVDQVMTALSARSRDRVSIGENFLQVTLSKGIALNGPYEVLSCGDLFTRLRALAKTEFEKLVLTKK